MGSPGRGNSGRGSDDNNKKKLQSFRRHSGGVSSALWPADMRRSLVTGRTAQRRHSPMRGKREVLLAMMLISMFVGGAIVAALVLRLEYMLLIPTAILTVITLFITPPLLLKLYRTLRRSTPSKLI